jgi:hypothetical protein
MEFHKHLEFQIRDASGKNIVGGVFIPASLNLLTMARWWNNSNYTADYATSLSNSYVFQYSFAASPTSLFTRGMHSNSHVFTGAELLDVVFTSALGSTYQLDLYAFIESRVDQTLSGFSVSLVAPENA